MTEDFEAAWRQALADSRAQLESALEHTRSLQRALISNRRIGIATGILMVQHTLTDREAFDYLVRVSQQHNRKVADIAEDVIYTGHLPDPPA